MLKLHELLTSKQFGTRALQLVADSIPVRLLRRKLYGKNQTPPIGFNQEQRLATQGSLPETGRARSHGIQLKNT